MSARVRVTREADGRLVAIKSAIGPTDAADLSREAEMLARARHPGVVDLVELRDPSGDAELVTGWVGARSLADVAPLPIESAIGVVGALAATVADLHRMGIVHTAIEPTHVLLDRHGRPVLCSFGRATMSGAVSPSLEGPAPRPSDDVAALGDLLAGAAGLPDDPEVVPTRRFGRTRGNHVHRAVLTVADHARADDPACRPSAAALAGALAELLPEAELPSDPEPGAHDHGSSQPAEPPTPSDDLEAQLSRLRATTVIVPRRRRGRWPLVTGTLAIALLTVGTATLWRGSFWAGALGAGSPSNGPPSGEPPAADLPDTVSVPTSARPAAPSTASTVSTAPIIEFAGARFSIGEPGDQVLVAEWRCDGRPLPLVLRPATGDVFLFDGVAEPGIDAVAVAFARVEQGSTIVPVTEDDSCPAPTLVGLDGDLVSLELPDRAP